MAATIPPSGWQISVMLPVYGRWQQFRLRAPVRYVCAACGMEKTTQLVAVSGRDWSEPTCGECYRFAITAENPGHSDNPADNGEPERAPLGLPQSSAPQRLTRGLRELVDVLIARAAGRELTLEEDGLVAKYSSEVVYPAALRYAYALIDREASPGEEDVNADRGRVRALLDQELRAVITERGRRQEEERTVFGSTERVQDPLPALVLSRLRTAEFRDALTKVLAEQGVMLRDLDMPAVTLWEWLSVLRQKDNPSIPPEVRDLRRLSTKSFKQHLVRMAREPEPSLAALSHPSILERWAAYANDVVKLLNQERRRVAKKLAKTPIEERNGLRQPTTEIDAYAMACAMETMATLRLQNLKHRVHRMFQGSSTRRERAARLVQAANIVVRNEPRLAVPTRDICVAHTASCPIAARGESCAECVPVILARLQALLSAPPPRPVVTAAPRKVPNPLARPAPRPSASRLPAPRLLTPDQTSHVRWAPGSDRIRVGPVKAMWQVAVTRDDVARGRCPLPEGTVLPPDEVRQLRLYFEHAGSALPPQRVTLRCLAGRWELSRVRWPKSLRSGLLVTFIWRTDGTTLTAATKPLRQPERIDGIEFRHEFDRLVVTRELAPGGRPSGGALSLSMENWVLRTLRVLGHLCPQGTATLAEDALLRNCLRLGMPPEMTDEIPKAVKALVAAGRIRQVRGGRDTYGDLWYPARRGDMPTDLLRYQPTIEVMKPQRVGRTGVPTNRSAHPVHGFVRRLPAGAHASEKQIELHSEAVAAAEVANRPLDPDRFTFVAKFRRDATRRGR
ncbi:hypothetical protein [Plantactinospora soyae]|uniref:Uncharacterized protein n=1 Tax=Plantactinospora soyae TaxID=1544732 RepID=A0A927M8W5_9ACTN|nr:hypothetical protein [Plantactinospora soyae]MBE1487493.1 hypothetical protein [Plantactinospora soyae]